MPYLNGLEFRRASPEHAFGIIKLYQLAQHTTVPDVAFVNLETLTAQLSSQSHLWIVAIDKENEILLAMSLMIDRDQHLAKIHRILMHPEWEDSRAALRESLPFLVQYLSEKGAEVLFTTSRTMTHDQLSMTIELGFKALGVFPKAIGADRLRVGGLTAYFFEDVLTKKRFAPQVLHEKIVPFFEMVRADCQLPAIQKNTSVCLNHISNDVPYLEMVHAPRFTQERFEKLKKRGSLSSIFYPFHLPTAFVTDPEQKIEIFLALLPEYKYAAILGERLERPVHQVKLYQKLAEILEQKQITYVEVISDVTDPVAIEVLLQSHFIPCGYLPAFKKLGETRRDFVVFSRSTEGLLRKLPAESPIHPRFCDYLGEFQKLDQAPL